MIVWLVCSLPALWLKRLARRSSLLPLTVLISFLSITEKSILLKCSEEPVMIPEVFVVLLRGAQTTQVVSVYDNIERAVKFIEENPQWELFIEPHLFFKGE